MYQPEVGDEITFVYSAFNRNTVYTITDISDAGVLVTTPQSLNRHDERVFAYRLTAGEFDSLGPQSLRATRPAILCYG